MPTTWQSAMEEFEASGRAIESQALSLDAALLSRSPRAGEWSPLQIVHHLVLADEQIGAPTHEAEGKRFRAPIYAFVLRAFRLNLRLPLPSPSLEPSGDVPLPILLERWDKAHRNLREQLAAAQSSGEELRFLHSIIGTMNTEQMLRLAQEHTKYHGRQLSRCIQKLQQSV